MRDEYTPLREPSLAYVALLFLLIFCIHLSVILFKEYKSRMFQECLLSVVSTHQCYLALLLPRILILHE